MRPSSLHAFKFLVDRIVKPNTHFVILSDNSALCSAFAKKRSGNEKIHKIISDIINSLLMLGSHIELKWINTNSMSEYADGPSRGVYPVDKFGLTREGVNRCYELYPSLRSLKNENNLVSLFGGPGKVGLSHVSPFCMLIGPTVAVGIIYFLTLNLPLLS